MFRYGITDRSQIPVAPAGIRPVYSYTLLGDFGEELSDAEEVAMTNICRQMGGGHDRLKRFTHPERYSHIDEVVAEEISRFFADTDAIRIHDMAASNAITSLELFDRLKTRNSVSVRATDRQAAVDVVTAPGGRWQVVFDANGEALQFVGRRMVIDALQPDRRRFPINRAMRRLLRLTLLPRAISTLQTGGRATVRTIPLFHPKSLAAARSDSRFTLGRDDLLDPLPGSYELLRIMGVFTELPDSMVERAVRAVGPRIVSGGLLVIGINNGQETTIFRKIGDGFEAVRHIGPGFDRCAVVESVSLS